MSVKIMGLVWDLQIKQNEKLVLLAYADHASHDGSSIYPSVALIAKKTGYSERSVQVITRSLETKGLLCADGQGKHGTNKWMIPLYMGAIVPVASRGAETAPPQFETSRGAENDTGGCRKTPKGVKPTAPEPSVNHHINHQLKKKEEIIKAATTTTTKALSIETFSNCVFAKVTGMLIIPAREREDALSTINALRSKYDTTDKMIDYLEPFWREWYSRSYRKTNLAWLTEWAVSGEIPFEQVKKGDYTKMMEALRDA